jgi:hypothetical protein
MKFGVSDMKKPDRMDKEDYVTNILLNLFSGLEPENLSEEEKQALREEHGDDWKKKFGYE